MAVPSSLCPRQADGARTAVAIVAAAFSAFLALATVAHALSWIIFRFDRVALVCIGLILLNLVLAPTAPRWALSRGAVYAYEGLHAVSLTVLLHFLGGLQISILVILYAFVVFHTQMLQPGASVIVAANLCALCYGVLAWLEATQRFAPGSVLDVPLSAGQHIGLVLVSALALNFLGLYAARYDRQLRDLAARLQEMVEERTAELKSANVDLAANARALEAKQQELDLLIYTITHDLKNPFNAIVLTAKLLQRRIRDGMDEESRADLGRIVRVAAYGEDMLRDLLRLLQVASVREASGTVDLTALGREAVDNLEPQIAERGVHVTVGPLPSVLGQPQKLRHVVGNLLGNAVKYVPPGHGEVSVTAERHDVVVTVRVRDNGIGIPSVYHRRIFELFGRVPSSGPETSDAPGSGVGLALVKRIVEDNGGVVWVESAPGAGASFLVQLPAADRR